MGNPYSETWRRKGKGCGREDLQKRKDLSLEWKSRLIPHLQWILKWFYYLDHSKNRWLIDWFTCSEAAMLMGAPLGGVSGGRLSLQMPKSCMGRACCLGTRPAADSTAKSKQSIACRFGDVCRHSLKLICRAVKITQLRLFRKMEE